ncbi:MAG: hypothetical protein ACTSPI_17200 [Candidatus Heimdallarchaeaceae archaeon]
MNKLKRTIKGKKGKKGIYTQIDGYLRRRRRRLPSVIPAWRWMYE